MSRTHHSSAARAAPAPIGDPFGGLDGGLYSKGEILRNKERRLLALRGENVTGSTQAPRIDLNRGGDPNGSFDPLDTDDDRRRKFEQLENEEERIPAAGYSGHIPRLHRIGVGKSFNIAAREARKEFIEDRLDKIESTGRRSEEGGTLVRQGGPGIGGNNPDTMRGIFNDSNPRSYRENTPLNGYSYRGDFPTNRENQQVRTRGGPQERRAGETRQGETRNGNRRVTQRYEP